MVVSKKMEMKITEKYNHMNLIQLKNNLKTMGENCPFYGLVKRLIEEKEA